MRQFAMIYINRPAALADENRPVIAVTRHF